MKDFNVLALGSKLNEAEVKLVIASFAEFYHRVTFKHQRRIKLKIVCDFNQAESILGQTRNLQVNNNVEVIPENDFNERNWSEQEASVLFLPTKERVGKVTRLSLSQGIPMVSFQNESISEYIDHSCGMLIRRKDHSQDKEAFSRILSMLYFDPEVRKLLKKGAETKYRQISGMRDLRETTSSRSRSTWNSNW